jgi:hypothetical protein
MRYRVVDSEMLFAFWVALFMVLAICSTWIMLAGALELKPIHFEQPNPRVRMWRT